LRAHRISPSLTYVFKKASTERKAIKFVIINDHHDQFVPFHTLLRDISHRVKLFTPYFLFIKTMNRPALINPVVRVVMAYEDVSLAKLAKEKWDSLVNNGLQDKFKIELRLWRLDALRIPDLRKVAADDAADTQMVFIVTRGTGELPIEVKNWVEQYLAQIDRNEAGRLLALLAGAPSDQFPSHRYFTACLFATGGSERIDGLSGIRCIALMGM
jgi:hypothetical protein